MAHRHETQIQETNVNTDQTMTRIEDEISDPEALMKLSYDTIFEKLLEKGRPGLSTYKDNTYMATLYFPCDSERRNDSVKTDFQSKTPKEAFAKLLALAIEDGTFR